MNGAITEDSNEGTLFTKSTRVRIADLNPSVPTPSGAHLEATVALVWPYSSSHGRLGLLLAEPDVRLRKAKGQVKVTFIGQCAREVAWTKIGIGDGIKLALAGIECVHTDVYISTPGKKADYDLEVRGRVTLEVRRGITLLAALNVVAHELPNASPVVAQTQLSDPNLGTAVEISTELSQWSSPFARSKRITSGSYLDASLDPFAEDDGFILGKGRKRTKFMRHSGSWKLDEGINIDDDLPSSPVPTRNVELLPETIDLTSPTISHPPDNPPVQKATVEEIIASLDMNEATAWELPYDQIQSMTSAGIDSHLFGPTLSSGSPPQVLTEDLLRTPAEFYAPPFDFLSHDLTTSIPLETGTPALRGDAGLVTVTDHVQLDTELTFATEASTVNQASQVNREHEILKFPHDEAIELESQIVIGPSSPTNLGEVPVDLDALQHEIDAYEIRRGELSQPPEERNAAIHDDGYNVNDAMEMKENEAEQYNGTHTDDESDSRTKPPSTLGLDGTDEEYGSEAARIRSRTGGSGMVLESRSREIVEIMSSSSESDVEEEPQPRQRQALLLPIQTELEFLPGQMLDSAEPQHPNRHPKTTDNGEGEPHASEFQQPGELVEDAVDHAKFKALESDSKAEHSQEAPDEISPQQGLPTPAATQEGQYQEDEKKHATAQLSLEKAPLTPRFTQEVTEPNQFSPILTSRKERAIFDDEHDDRPSLPPAPSRGMSHGSQRLSRTAFNNENIGAAYFTPRKSTSRLVSSPTSKTDGLNSQPLLSSPAINKEPLQYSPPRSVMGGNEDQQRRPNDLSHGFTTPLAYFVHFSSLFEHFGHEVDVMAVCSDSTNPPERAKSGPRDYHVTLRLTDPSCSEHTNFSAQIFRPSKAALPVLMRGQVVLLRNMKVITRAHKPFLLSVDTSAWVTFRESPEKGLSASTTGPPVEYGEAELKIAQSLRDWWYHAGEETHPVSAQSSSSRARNRLSSQPVDLGNNVQKPRSTVERGPREEEEAKLKVIPPQDAQSQSQSQSQSPVTPRRSRRRRRKDSTGNAPREAISAAAEVINAGTSARDEVAAGAAVEQRQEQESQDTAAATLASFSAKTSKQPTQRQQRARSSSSNLPLSPTLSTRSLRRSSRNKQGGGGGGSKAWGENEVHELRDGLRYVDEADGQRPEADHDKGSKKPFKESGARRRRRKSSLSVIHELRDGSRYVD